VNANELKQEIVTNPKIQAVVASGSMATGAATLMEYIEFGSAVVALVGGAVLVVYMIVKSHQEVRNKKLENRKLKLEIEAIERRKKARD